jgi:hypothetical protein
MQSVESLMKMWKSAGSLTGLARCTRLQQCCERWQPARWLAYVTHSPISTVPRTLARAAVSCGGHVPESRRHFDIAKVDEKWLVGARHLTVASSNPTSKYHRMLVCDRAGTVLPPCVPSFYVLSFLNFRTGSKQHVDMPRGQGCWYGPSTHKNSIISSPQFPS